MIVTHDERERHRPDTLLPPDPEFADSYAAAVERGRLAAANASVTFVAICRNAMPWLHQTLGLVEETGSLFKSWSAFIFENDSTDGTKDVLAAWHDGTQRYASIGDNGRPHLNFTTDPMRTHALAEYRATCQEFVKSRDPVDYVIVFDTDPWGGWSLPGVLHSVAWLEAEADWYGLAAYSWCEWGRPMFSAPTPAHYDAFAARKNHWRQRDQWWFHLWHPPVGGSPVEFNSAFGQLAIYRASSFVGGTYTGEDCEHVCFHRTIQRRATLDGDRPFRFGVNPAMRVVSFWTPDEVKRAEG
jgi:hypothetical protein